MPGFHDSMYRDGEPTERVAAGELWLLGVPVLQNVANAVEEFHVALLGVLLKGLNECV